MKRGDAVLVVAPWSSFHGMRGEVTQAEPHVMVLLDGETKPLRMGATEIIPAEESTRHIGGAE